MTTIALYNPEGCEYNETQVGAGRHDGVHVILRDEGGRFAAGLLSDRAPDKFCNNPMSGVDARNNQDSGLPYHGWPFYRHRDFAATIRATSVVYTRLRYSPRYSRQLILLNLKPASIIRL